MPLGKQCCILDAISLVKLCQLELGLRRAIEWLLEDFDVSIPQKVFNEGRSNIHATDDDAAALFFTAVQSRVHYESIESCDQIIKRQVKSLPVQERTEIHNGERVAAALALKLSYSYKQYVVFVTDDLDAVSPIEKILDRDQIGLVKNSYDLLLFLASRHLGELTLDVVEIALKQLNYLLRNNSPDAPKYQEPDELLDVHLNEVVNLFQCRRELLTCVGDR